MRKFLPPKSVAQQRGLTDAGADGMFGSVSASSNGGKPLGDANSKGNGDWLAAGDAGQEARSQPRATSMRI